jgi:hypothetical protein
MRTLAAPVLNLESLGRYFSEDSKKQAKIQPKYPEIITGLLYSGKLWPYTRLRRCVIQ